jgi:hypothetical protein
LAWAKLLVTQGSKVKRPPKKSRAVHDNCCCIRNHHRGGLVAHDVHYAITHHLSAATCPCCQGCTIASTTKRKVQDNRTGHRRVGPNCRFIASPEVGLGATVVTLQTRYPYVQALTQDKEQDMHPRVATCPAAPEPASLIGRAPTPPRVSWLRTRL